MVLSPRSRSQVPLVASREKKSPFCFVVVCGEERRREERVLAVKKLVL